MIFLEWKNSRDVPMTLVYYYADVNTVIDVLLRSERDKHDAQLDECLSFCHANLDLVLNHHGNALLEVSDSTIKKLAFLFHHHEVEAIRDKRDRIKRYVIIFRYRYYILTPSPVTYAMFKTLHCYSSKASYIDI